MKTFLPALLAAFCCALARAQPPRSPMDWTTIRTNQVEQWKAANGASGVKTDKAARRVTLLAEATGLPPSEAVEFFAIGPLSDRAYESMFVTVASPAAIAAAVERIGLPRGIEPNALKARMWPQGEKVKLSAKRLKDGAAWSPAQLMSDAQSAAAAPLEKALVWTGGERDAAGAPLAATNIPCAVFSVYTSPQSLLLLDGMFDQAAVYGRFKPKTAFEKGELFELVLEWDGVKRVRERAVLASAANAAAELARLKAESKTAAGEMYVRLGFAKGVKLAEAAGLAKAFSLLDGKELKLNGAAEGQFYFQAYLPDEEWRNRAKRIYQPFEVSVAKDGRKEFTFIEEDWSGEALDPELKPKTTVFEKWDELPGMIKGLGEQGEKIFVMFVYAPPDMAVDELFPLKTLLEKRITTFYLFDSTGK